MSDGYVLSPIEVDGKVVSAMPDTVHPDDRAAVAEEAPLPAATKAKK